MTDSMQVANTIRDQLAGGRTADNTQGFIAMGSWGANNFTGCGATEKDRGWLSFSVKGARFKGHVKVRLTHTDMYCVEFFKFSKWELKRVNTIDDVFCQDLTSVIDNFVEKKVAA